jgi:Putative Flp pilus-assembly TadE/G-like
MLVYFAVILTVLIGFCGLTLDTGLIEVRTLQLQSAADAAAIGVATEVSYGYSNTMQQAANSDVASYESLNGLPGTAPDPVVLGVSGDYSTVGVTIHQSVNTIFMGVLSRANANITLAATAVAAFPPCMYFFGNPNLNMGFNTLRTQAYEIASAGVDPPLGCPVYTASGVSIDYFARLAGMQLKNSGPAGVSLISGNLSVPPLYNVPVMSDPLAYLAAPSPGSCANASPLSYTSSTTLHPGTYCGKTSGSVTTPAISVSANCSTTTVVTLSPGLYIIAGGIYFDCVTVQGTGVTMYFTNKSGVGYGIFNLYSSTWNVSAPTDPSAGGLPGIVIFGDRNWSGGNQDFSLMFSTWVGDGVIYVSNTGIYDWITPMSAPNYLNIVAANMYSYNGEIRPAINYASLPAGNPLQTVVTLVQ